MKKNEESGVHPEPEKMLMEVTNVEDTPFTCIRYEDKYFLALGKYRLSELMETKEEVEEDAKNTSWERLLSCMYAVAKTVIEEQNAKAEAQKEAINLKINKQ